MITELEKQDIQKTLDGYSLDETAFSIAALRIIDAGFKKGEVLAKQYPKTLTPEKVNEIKAYAYEVASKKYGQGKLEQHIKLAHTGMAYNPELFNNIFLGKKAGAGKNVIQANLAKNGKLILVIIMVIAIIWFAPKILKGLK